MCSLLRVSENSAFNVFLFRVGVRLRTFCSSLRDCVVGGIVFVAVLTNVVVGFQATKLYCFVHKVPVCGECICFPEHQICVV